MTKLWSDEQLEAVCSHGSIGLWRREYVLKVRDDYEAELARLRAGFNAADEIMKRAIEESARLRARIAELEAALYPFVNHWFEDGAPTPDWPDYERAQYVLAQETQP